MKKLVLVSSLFLFSILVSFAQKEANVWYFGQNAGLDFNSGSPVPLSNGQMDTNEGCASISDKTTGQLLFYTDGSSVWDRNQNLMPNGTGLYGNYSSTQSAVIVPMPGSTTKFYIFTADAQAGNFTVSLTGYGGIAYSIVDMTLNGGNGDVSVLNTQLITPACEKIAAVRNCNGNDIWIVVHKWNSNAFYSYLLTSSGVSAPVISNSGTVIQDAGSGYAWEAIGYMKLSPDGKKLAMADYVALNEIQIFDFNNATGVVSNPVTDVNFPNISGDDGPYGISFSPDNSRLYVGVFGDNTFGGTSYVYQYNMLAGNGAAIIASRTAVLTDDVNFIGALQIGPDGKIYVAKQNDFGGGPSLDVINNPNSLGDACNYASDQLYLGGIGLSAYGLPDMVESFTAVPYSANLNYITCTGNSTLTFNDTILNGTINVNWNFGDPGSGAANTSSQQNPSHMFSGSGSYTVTLYISNTCKTDTFVQTIVTGGSISVNAGPDTSICSGNYVQLNASGGSTYSWSPTTQLTDPNIANPYATPQTTTTYTVTISAGGCSSTATVTINVATSPPTPDITQSSDTLYCSYDPSYTAYQWYDSSTAIPGAVNPYLVVSHNGNYNVSVTNENGCSIAVGITVVYTGIKNYVLWNSFSLSPNPADDELTLSGSLTGGKVRISIYNALGQDVYSSDELESNSFKHQINVSGFSKGIYLVKVQQAEGNWTGKFIKE